MEYKIVTINVFVMVYS